MGEADLLSKGEGTGEAIRRGGESKDAVAVSSPSLRPEMRRLVRGRRVEVAVKLEEALLAFITGRAALEGSVDA